jgi:oligopeptide/dipeptide ABC transporter ATP-binding protein
MKHVLDAELLEVTNLAVEYRRDRRRPPLRAVKGVSLSIAPGETLGLVGESGSGKSTIGRAILGLAPITQGAIRLGGRDITRATRRERRELSAELQTVFQDPYSSLNPARTVGQTLGETLLPHGIRDKAEITDRVAAMLGRVGLPTEAARSYPAQFSGGQRQRIAIARALMMHPRLVICDEAVSALDLSVQAQVLNLLNELQDEFGLSYLFISHDLAVVRHVAHRIVVLYRGQIMESGNAAAVYERPSHPYTVALLQAAPLPAPALQRDRRRIRRDKQGDVGAPAPESGCPFAPRCRHADALCWSTRPRPEPTPDGVLVACHHWRALWAGSHLGRAETPIAAVSAKQPVG